MSIDRDDFEISIICALPLEAQAVKAILEEEFEIGKAEGDINIYTTGKIGRHNVVLVHMPGMGKIPAAAVASNLTKSFKKIRLTLVVGICGGVPAAQESLMLGDVVIGKQVVHYDFGRQYENEFEMKSGPEDGLGRQGPEIRGFVRKLIAGQEDLEGKVFEYLAPTIKSWGPEKLNSLQDILYPADYWHVHQGPKSCTCRDGVDICDIALRASCEELDCDTDESIRPTDPKPKPNIYFGTVASGDRVMRSATIRDSLARKHEVIAFDMEVAGIWDYLPCILVKGVCDYADSHKNKNWQEYAAASAAACAKALLEQWTQNQVDRVAKKARDKSVFNVYNYNAKIGNQAQHLNLQMHGNTNFF